MAFDEKLANRVRDVFAGKSISTEEKRMMGGLCFMVNDKMCVGIDGNQLMVRLDPAIYEECLQVPGCVPMEFTGRPMRGFVFVESEAIRTKNLLCVWIDKALEFDPLRQIVAFEEFVSQKTWKFEDKKRESMKRLLAVLAYVLPTFPLGYFWHLTVFADYYKNLAVFRDEMIIPFGIASMLIQGFVWAIVYEKMFAGQTVVRGAFGFASIAFPIAWTYMVLAVAAKHHMASVSGYVLIETAFVAAHYAIVSPLIAFVYSNLPAKTS